MARSADLLQCIIVLKICGELNYLEKNRYFMDWLCLILERNIHQRMIKPIFWYPRRYHRGLMWSTGTPTMKARLILWLPGNSKYTMWRERNGRTTSSLVWFLLTYISLYLESLNPKDISFVWKGWSTKENCSSPGMQGILQEIFHTWHDTSFLIGRNQYRVLHVDIWLQYEVKGIYSGTVLRKFRINGIHVN